MFLEKIKGKKVRLALVDGTLLTGVIVATEGEGPFVELTEHDQADAEKVWVRWSTVAMVKTLTAEVLDGPAFI